MLLNYQAHLSFVLKHTTSMYVWMYVCMERMPLNALGATFFPLKTRLFRLDPSLFWNYSIKQALL